MNGMKAKMIIKKTIFLLAMFGACMLAAYGLRQMGLRNESVFMVFIVGVLITALEMSGFLWNLALSLLLVLGYNFFFTAPYFTLMVYDVNYYVSWFVFIVVGIIVNTLATRLQHEASVAYSNQKAAEWLYKTSTGFLNLADRDDICTYTRRRLNDLLNRSVEIHLGEPDKSDRESAYCFKASLAVGHGESYYASSPYLYLPLKSKNATLGVVRVMCGDSDLDESERRNTEAAITLAVMALERSRLEETAREDRFDIERENLRNNLLRSVSHDLRTPLTSIVGDADFLLKNEAEVDEASRKSMLSDISIEAVWLSDMVENLLAMTRVQDGQVPINKTSEPVDDIVSNAIARTRKRRGSHKLNVQVPDDVVLAPMDGTLIVQVLVNLIDNAIKHTRSDSTIDVSVRKAADAVEFSVADDGGGIDPDKLGKIFDSFYAISGDSDTQPKGMGLGLAICRAIVEAHGGHIVAENNDRGGATFTFSIPCNEQPSD
jgi:two-component system sensor histidine kinase KdpD